MAQPSIHRYQIIHAADLEAVAGVIDHRDIGVLCSNEKLAHSALEIDDAEIVARNDGVETDRFEQCCDRFGVIAGVGQRRCVRIGGDSDHQRDPTLRCGRIGAHRADDEAEDVDREPALFHRCINIRNSARSDGGTCAFSAAGRSPSP